MNCTLLRLPRIHYMQKSSLHKLTPCNKFLLCNSLKPHSPICHKRVLSTSDSDEVLAAAPPIIVVPDSL